MDQTERDAIRLLDPLREVEPETPSSVSVPRAVHHGRRRARNRRLAGVAAAVVMSLAVVSSVVGALTPDPPADPGAPGPAEFGALQMAFTVGSAAGYTPLTYETGRYKQVVELVGTSQPDDATQVTVTMFSARPLYQQGTARPWYPGNDRAPDVNGHPAYWQPPTSLLPDGTYRTSAAQAAELAWEWADGAWAFVAVYGPDEDDRAKAHRVAESVAPAGDQDVTMPFTIPRAAVEADELTGAIVSYGRAGQANGRIRAFLIFSNDTLGVGGRRSAVEVLVGVQQDLTRDPRLNQQTTPFAENWRVRDLGAGFFAVAEVSRIPEELNQVRVTQRMTELAHAVRLVDNPTNPDSWVSDPLR